MMTYKHVYNSIQATSQVMCTLLTPKAAASLGNKSCGTASTPVTPGT